MYTPEYLTSTKDYYVKNFSQVSCTVGDFYFSYFIVPNNKGPEHLPHFLHAFFSGESYLFAISDKIPSAYQKYFVLYELLRNLKKLSPHKALEEELSHIPKNIKRGYLAERIIFYEELVANAGEYSHFSKENIEEFKLLLELLKSQKP